MTTFQRFLLPCLAMITLMTLRQVSRRCLLEPSLKSNLLTSSDSSPEMSTSACSPDTILRMYEIANQQLTLSSEVTKLMGDDECGFERECPQWYSPRSIQQSADIGDAHASIVSPPMNALLQRTHEEARAGCASDTSGLKVLSSGGWCLQPGTKGTIDFGDIHFPLSSVHSPPSRRIVDELLAMIRAENITSFNDFGAGVGQYRHAVLTNTSNVRWTSYDAAGNVQDYTHNFVQYVDLRLPLELPKAQWVLSLEVGEHVPNSFEPMVLRNLHHHNCKGIVLSWAIVGQGGRGHINTHSNDYIRNVMTQLGYEADLQLEQRMRMPENNHAWFTKSVMVFRRTNDSVLPEICKTL